MSIYFDKKRGYKFDFTLDGQRHTSRYFKTKKEAKEEEAKRREEILNPPPKQAETLTDMAFLDLVNLRLDHLKAYNSSKHYQDTVYSAKKWTERWGGLKCSEITPQMVREYLLVRRKVSPVVGKQG